MEVNLKNSIDTKKSQTENHLIPESKLYELALDERKHKEDRRDQINSYYISIFAAIIAILPFLDKISEGASDENKGYIVKISLTVLSFIGLILSMAWSANLRRLLTYLQSVDKLILDMEEKYTVSFISYISQQLQKKKSPDRITKYQIILPYTFMLIFVSTIVYSLQWIVTK